MCSKTQKSVSILALTVLFGNIKYARINPGLNFQGFAHLKKAGCRQNVTTVCDRNIRHHHVKRNEIYNVHEKRCGTNN